jgi:hypothetical protein
MKKKENVIIKYEKARGPERLRIFKEEILPKLRLRYQVSEGKNDTFTINGTLYGVVFFNQKGNKCFLWKKSRWIKPGFEWMVKNLLKDGK